MIKVNSKQILSVLLAIIMVISLLPITVSAQEQTADDKDYVAEVNGVGYIELQEAIDAANSGDTVTLLCDIDYDVEVAKGYCVTIDKSLTLDLGEYYIRHTLPNYSNNSFINPDDGVAYTIAVLGIKPANGATNVIINATTGGITTASNRYAINNGYTSGNSTKSNVTINGGNYIGGDTCIKHGRGTMTINGGSFKVTSKSYPNQYVLHSTNGYTAYCKFVVNGGRFYQFNPACCYVNNAKFSHDYQDFMGEGMTAVLDDDGWYTVVKGQRVAQTKYWCHATLDDAIANVDAKRGYSTKTHFSDANIDIQIIADIEISEEDAAEVIAQGLNVYKVDAEPTLPTDYIWDENNKLIVAPSVEYVAEVYGEKFNDLQEAIDAAVSGGTVTLLKEVTFTTPVIINKSLSLELGTYTLTSTAEEALRIVSGESIDVTIAANEGGGINATGYAINAGNGENDDAKTNVTINGGTYVSQSEVAIRQINGLLTVNNGSYKSSFSRTVLNGKRWYGAEFKINGGSFYGFNPACVSVWTGFDGNDYTNFYHQHDIIAEGKTVVYENGMYTVVEEGGFEAKVQTKSLCYPTVSAALEEIVEMNDVANLGVLTLLANDEMTETDVALAMNNNFSFICGEYELTLPEGYELYDATLEDGRAAVKVKPAVSGGDSSDITAPTETVEVGNADELKAAVDNGKNITLTGNIEFDNVLELNLADGSILDLNGHTITLPKAGATVSGNGITIKNGTIACSHKKPQYLLYIAEGTTATIEGVTISNGAIYAKNGAELTLKDNTIKPWASGNASAVYADGAKVTVLSGTFNGSTQGIFKEAYGGEITVYSGRFDRKNASYKVSLSNFVAEGSELVKAVDGVYKYEVVYK